MSQRAPGYRFQYQVPPTSSASSSATTVKPALRRRCRRYRPAKPAPTTATSTSSALALLVACEARASTIASGMPLLPWCYILLQAIAAYPVCHQGNFYLRPLHVRQTPVRKRPERMLADWAMRPQDRLKGALA